MRNADFTPRLQYTDWDIISKCRFEPPKEWPDGVFKYSGEIIPVVIPKSKGLDGEQIYLGHECWKDAVMVQLYPTKRVDHAIVCLEWISGIWGSYKIDSDLDCFTWRWPTRYWVRYCGWDSRGSGQGRTLCEAICRAIMNDHPTSMALCRATDEDMRSI